LILGHPLHTAIIAYETNFILYALSGYEINEQSCPYISSFIVATGLKKLKKLLSINIRDKISGTVTRSVVYGMTGKHNIKVKLCMCLTN
jgi:hypothetical protein